MFRRLPSSFTRKTGAAGRPAPSRRRAAAPRLEGLESRVVLYSASGNAWPAPQLITLSFMPDGTNVGGKSSNLMSTFNAKFGSASAWENVFLKAAQTWAAQTNINFAVVPDSGAPQGAGTNQQGDPNFGDIRIGGYNFNSTTLAQAYMPPPVNNYSVAGDVLMNTGQSFNNGTTYDLYTVAVHEIGHALGLYHSGVASAEEYASYNGSKGALGSDDIAGIQSIYGGPRKADAYDAAGSDDTTSTAVDITSKIDPTALTAVVTGLDLTATSDKDVYSFTPPANATGNLTLTVQSKGFSLLSPSVTLMNSRLHGLASASGPNQYGTTLTLSATGINPGQVYYVQVQGADTTAFSTGAYALTLNFGSDASPTVPLPNATKANGSPLSSGGGQAVKINQETLANTTTKGSQFWSGETRQNVGMDANGNFVMAWESTGADDTNGGVYAQRFDASGNKLGGEFRVNTTTANFQGFPAVAMAPTGNFLISWSSVNQDGSGYGIYAQRYDANGSKVGGEFRVNATTYNDQTDSVPAFDASGNAVITWSSLNQDGSGYGVYAQRYDANGNPAGGEFRVNTTTAGDQRYSSVAAFPGGGFVITWTSAGQDGSGDGVYAQRYDVNGVPLGGEFRVNTTTAGNQNAPSVSANAAGTFAITWSSNGQDGSGYGVYAQRYDATGAPLGGEFRVNTTTARDQRYSSASLDNGGDLLITWAAYGGSASNWNIMAQQYAPDGTPLGGEFQINTSTGYFQQAPSAVMDNQGHVVAAWYGGSAADSSGVFFQSYSISFSGDSSDGFYAEGDPNDPDQAHPAPGPVPVGPSHAPAVPLSVVGDHDAALQAAIDRALAEVARLFPTGAGLFTSLAPRHGRHHAAAHAPAHQRPRFGASASGHAPGTLRFGGQHPTPAPRFDHGRHGRG